jgi:hypothetical protein
VFLDFVTPMHFDRLTVRDSKKRASSRVSEMKPMSVARIGARANRSTLDDSRARRTVTARERTPWTLAVEERRTNPGDGWTDVVGRVFGSNWKFLLVLRRGSPERDARTEANERLRPRGDCDERGFRIFGERGVVEREEGLSRPECSRR